MRKLIMTMWMSLDGFISGPDNDMSWVMAGYNNEMSEYEDGFVSVADTLLLGRVTYESFAGSWPKVPDNPEVSAGEREYAKKLNAMKKIVFSRSMVKADWNNSSIYKEIKRDEIMRLKQMPGKNIIIYGSASIVKGLSEMGLIDEYQILVYPVLRGSGKRLFDSKEWKIALKLLNTDTYSSGVAAMSYAPQIKEV